MLAARMNPVSVFVVSAAILLVENVVDAATGTGYVDISDGYCKTGQYGNIPVGGSYYSSSNECVRVDCDPDRLNVHSCGMVDPPSSPNCVLQPGRGVYPNCCKQMVCY